MISILLFSIQLLLFVYLMHILHVTQKEQILFSPKNGDPAFWEKNGLLGKCHLCTALCF